MSRFDKILLLILRGTSDTNVPFESLRSLLVKLGFEERNHGGSHHIFTMTGMEEIINIQPNNGKAKPYQVKQVRDIILKYRLGESR